MKIVYTKMVFTGSGDGADQLAMEDVQYDSAGYVMVTWRDFMETRCHPRLSPAPENLYSCYRHVRLWLENKT